MQMSACLTITFRLTTPVFRSLAVGLVILILGFGCLLKLLTYGGAAGSMSFLREQATMPSRKLPVMGAGGCGKCWDVSWVNLGCRVGERPEAVSTPSGPNQRPRIQMYEKGWTALIPSIFMRAWLPAPSRRTWRQRPHHMSRASGDNRSQG